MKDIAIYGAGGFGREVACLIKLINKNKPQWNFIGYFDDGIEKETELDYGSVLGNIEDVNNWPIKLAIIVSIGKPLVVRHLISKCLNENIYFPNLISPDMVSLDTNNFVIGRGNIICSNCFFSTNVQIGDFNVFNTFVPIGHDVKIGSYNQFMSMTNISGAVLIGNENFFGVKSTVLQGVRIGNRNTIGTTSLITRKVKDDQVLFGCPAKSLPLPHKE